MQTVTYFCAATYTSYLTSFLLITLFVKTAAGKAPAPKNADFQSKMPTTTLELAAATDTPNLYTLLNHVSAHVCFTAFSRKLNVLYLPGISM